MLYIFKKIKILIFLRGLFGEDRGGNCHPFPLGSAYVLTIKLYKVCGKRSLTHFMGFPTDPTIKTSLTGKSMIGELEEKERKK